VRTEEGLSHPTPVAAVHRLLIAAPQHCAGHAATEAAQIRGLPGLAARSVQHSIALARVFCPVEYFGYVAVKKNSLHFRRKEKKQAIWWSAGLGGPRLGYFYFKDLSLVFPEKRRVLRGGRVHNLGSVNIWRGKVPFRPPKKSTGPQPTNRKTHEVFEGRGVIMR
jgi:hypothetical protein